MYRSSTNRKRTIWTLGAVICAALLGMALWLFNDPLSRDAQLNWDIQGTWITADGQVLETLAFSLSGEIEKHSKERDILRLNIRLPEDFDYVIPEEPTIFYSNAEVVESVSYYICGGAYCLERTSGDMTLVELALSEKQEFMILYFSETPGTFLVASTNHNVKPEEILAYFDFFVKQKTA